MQIIYAQADSMVVYGAAYEKGIISLEILYVVLTQPVLKILKRLDRNPIPITADFWQRIRVGLVQGPQTLWAIQAQGFQQTLDKILNEVISLENRERVMNKMRKDGFLRVSVGLGFC